MKSEGYVFHPQASVTDLASRIGHTAPILPTDPHADKQLAVEFLDRRLPIPPSGDSRDMCTDCQGFFCHCAVNGATRSAIVTTDPHATRVFHPDGSITKIVDATGSYYNEVSPGPSGLTEKNGKTKVGAYTEYPDGSTKTWLDGNWKKPPDPGASGMGM